MAPSTQKKNLTIAKKTNLPPSVPEIWGLDVYILLEITADIISTTAPNLFLPTSSSPSSLPAAVDPATSPQQLHQKAKMPPEKRST
jgi:hypothetical protein